MEKGQERCGVRCSSTQARVGASELEESRLEAREEGRI